MGPQWVSVDSHVELYGMPSQAYGARMVFIASCGEAFSSSCGGEVVEVVSFHGTTSTPWFAVAILKDRQ